MTIEIYQGPGIDTYKSTRFVVDIVNGSGSLTTQPYCYGVTHSVAYAVPGFWEADDFPGVSWVTIGSNETVTAIVKLLSGPITTYRVYPIVKEYQSELINGELHITLPTRSKVWVEVNFTEGNVLSAESVDSRGNPLWICVDQLKPYIDISSAVVYDKTQLKANTGETLYFGPGVWNLTTDAWGEKLFRIESGATVYLDGGAWVIGSFDVRGSNNVTITGPGVMSGEWTSPEFVRTLSGYANKYLYGMIVGLNYGFTPSFTGNTLSQVMLVNCPFHAIVEGMNNFYDVKIIAPWWANCDGLKGTRDVNNLSKWIIDHCICWTGDDCFDVSTWRGNCQLTESIGASTGSSVFLFGYSSENPDWWFFEQAVTNNYVVSVANYYSLDTGQEGGEVIKAWADESADHSNWGIFNVTIDELDIEGPTMRCPIFSMKNKPDPWEGGEAGAGQISNWVISNVRTQCVPMHLSMLQGFDAINTPHDVLFKNINMAGNIVTNENWSTYVVQGETVYNRTIIADSITPVNRVATFLKTPNVERSFTFLLVGRSVSSAISKYVGISLGTGRGVPVTRSSGIALSRLVSILTTNEPIPTGTSSIPYSKFNISINNSRTTVNNIIVVDQTNLVQILDQLNNRYGDVSYLPADSQKIWSKTVLENLSPNNSKQIINIMTSNY